MPITATAQNLLNESCLGDAEGSFELEYISYGTAPTVPAGNPNNFVANQNYFPRLAAGSYEVFIEDAIGCQTSVKSFQ